MGLGLVYRAMMEELQGLGKILELRGSGLEGFGKEWVRFGRCMVWYEGYGRVWMKIIVIRPSMKKN